MTVLNTAQIVVSIAAILLQIWATYLAKPLAVITPKKLWSSLMLLNFFVLARRILSLAEIEYQWHGENYETTAALVGFAVSVFMLLSITQLRQHLLHEKQEAVELAEATLKLAHNVKAEDSGAYKLALSFIQEREARQDVNKAQGEAKPPTS